MSASKHVYQLLLTLILSVMVSPLSVQAGSSDCEKAYSKDEPKPLTYGTPAGKAAELARKKADFLERASLKNPDLVEISAADLDTMRKEYSIVGVTGYSRDFDHTTPDGQRKYEAYKSEITAFLSGLDPDRVMIASGGTQGGVPGLVAEVARDMNFYVVGITALGAAGYEPHYMDFCFLESAPNFGSESRRFLGSIDALFALGGGNQAKREIILSQEEYLKPDGSTSIPLLAIKNKNIDGASTQVPYETLGNGSQAAERARHVLYDPSDLLTRHNNPIIRVANVIPVEQLKNIYGSKKVLGFSGWSRRVPKNAEQLGQFKKFVNDILDRLNPDEILLATSGSDLGMEAIVHELATKRERPFRIVALTADEIKVEDIYRNVDNVFSVSKSWNGRVLGFINNIGGLISGGGGPVISDQLLAAKQRGIPFVHFPGLFVASDLLNPVPQNTVTDPDSAMKILGL